MLLSELPWEPASDDGPDGWLRECPVGRYIIYENYDGSFDIACRCLPYNGNWYDVDPIAAQAVLFHITQGGNYETL